MALFAVGASLLLDLVFTSLGVRPPPWLDTPAVMGFYGLFHRLYDQVLWRVPVGPLRLSPVPCVAGTWVGSATTSHNGGSRTSVVVTVCQTWTKILVRLETDHSVSRSLMAAIHTHEASQPGLTYEYLNEPKVASSVETMHTHRGMATLHLSPDGEHLEGDYYTGRDRGNVGALRLSRVSPRLLSRDDALRAATSVPRGL